MNSALNTQHSQSDVIVIGSGIGGLCAAGLLARYGKRVIVCESHAIPGGAAHSFRRREFEFDSGPSFYCGLTDAQSLNPVTQVLKVLGESLQVIPYDPLGHYHFPEAIFAVYGNAEKYLAEVDKITPQGAKEFQQFAERLLKLYEGMKGIPTLALRADWQVILVLMKRYLPSLAKMLPNLPLVQSSVGNVMDATVKDPWVRRLIDLECFLLSGLKAHGTIAPEVAFMLGERSRAGVEYPVGGSGAIVNALVRGLERWGGQLRLGCHVDQILVESGKAVGVKLQNGEVLKAPIVISNATIWDTYNHLLRPEDLPASCRQVALETPFVDSFMHLHLGIKANDLENLTGHHVVVHDSNQDISVPGNTCMISIPSVWDATLAPEGHHVVHAYTLEPYVGWERNDGYEAQKKEKAQTLYRALERVIPDIRERVVLELIGTPLTHAHYLRRYQGTYGPAIVAGKGMFPGMQTPIKGLYRVGDSTMPGIGVPAVAASGILCANSLVTVQEMGELLDGLKF
ncbi:MULTISPECIES: NAD(P)/FAD-dependent oxidoreductase [unclassified Nodularia (in: cyanobacteria)]|uniref:phytoene desaturase family protein n=1 Tax=unclassified Nodularia (in: cyanobacteria) TaxID=2656917 RepID=UPI00188275AE|nr:MULTISPECIES: NAD(P)/FAD-dependent oxidoreductase [unclassified Nodularia (in: cyanobacteria)]MBE9202073.1 FAD-dependent oxidoreductase [Nodularia sp. LEGE 06071]MCC2695620.1 FAD-dependent oxidoreductase [Nodularia sp. LEGE 04288]